MFQSFLGEHKEHNEKAKRFYISRRDAKDHKIKNEEEVIGRLEKLGFKAITMSDYTLAARSELFAEAEILISIHGAGLISMLFCPPSTKVLEIFTESYIDPFFTEMALQLGVDHHYIICPDEEKKTYKTAFEIYDDDVSINIPLLMDKLEALGIANESHHRRLSFPVSVSSKEERK